MAWSEPTLCAEVICLNCTDSRFIVISKRLFKPKCYDRAAAFDVTERMSLRTAAAQPEVDNSMSIAKLTLFVVNCVKAKVSPLVAVKLRAAFRVGTLRKHRLFPHTCCFSDGFVYDSCCSGCCYLLRPRNRLIAFDDFIV